MRQFQFRRGVVLAGAIGLAIWSAGVVAYAQDPSSTMLVSDDSASAGVEVMTRGPIHEAFAQPVNSGGISPLVVPKESPEAIEEIPPDTKPADPSAIWISGYWAWDDDRKDFNWVSGVWRVPPPGQRWVAGYWTAVSGGYSWVAGFWTPVEQEGVAYYPEPPASLEQGPTSDPPSADHVWVSGCWRWTDSRYAWQPGYWAEAQPDWIWVPASYYWSPRGWVFCDGYWDYRLDRRGLIFAPVYFTSAVYRRPGFFYSPSVVLDSSLLTFYLFVRPSYHHYYFGDYYATSYDGLGFYPWFAVRRHPSYGYDPLFAYYGWRNRDRDPDWAKNLQTWHAYYRAHPDKRLPHDLASAQRIAAKADDRPDRQFLKIADNLHDWRKRSETTVPLTTVSAEQKTKFHESARLMRQFGTERGRMEVEGVAGATTGRTIQPTPGTATGLKAPETLRLPQTARKLSEGGPSPLKGKARQTLKPLTPPSPPQQLKESTGEVQKSMVPVQPPRKEFEPRGTQEKKLPQGKAEKVTPLPRKTEGKVEKVTPPPRKTERSKPEPKSEGKEDEGNKGTEGGTRGRR